MKSLYDSLHLVDPSKPDVQPAPLPASFSVKSFSQDIIRSVEFRRYILNGLTLGDLPAAVVCRIMDHAVDVDAPVERFEGLSIDQLEARAIHTLEILRQLRRTNDVVHPPSSDEEDSTPFAVH